MTVTPILTRALRYGGVLALGVALVAGAIGLLVAGVPGLLGGLFGAVLAALFLGITAVSMLVAGRVAHGDTTGPTFFGIVLGVWLLKLVAFVVAAIVLGRLAWVDPYVFFFSVIAAVVGSLVADIVAFVRARVPYVSDVTLPGEPAAPSGARKGAE